MFPLKESHTFMTSLAKCISVCRGLDVVLPKRWRKQKRRPSLSDLEFYVETPRKGFYFQVGGKQKGGVAKDAE